MAKVRVYELAKELGVESKAIMAKMQELGEFVRSASSTIEPAIVHKLRASGLGKTHGTSDGTNQPGRPPSQQPSSLAEQVHSVAAGVSPNDNRPAEIVREPSSTIKPVLTTGKIVQLQGLGSYTELDTVIRECRAALQRGVDALTFDMTDTTGFYPSVAVPVAAVLDWSRSHGVRVAMRGVSPVLEKMSVRNPLEASRANLTDNEPLSRVWAYFDDQQANQLTNSYMDVIRRKIVCTTGVLEALEWCLYEVLDNVVQHAQSGTGFAMMQMHARTHRLAVCVGDTGRGVQRSLAESANYKPRTAFDALTLAIKEGVTRDNVSNQGNGLFGLFRIVEQNNGRLTMRSGRGLMLLQGDRISGNNNQPILGPDNHGTFVDFQLVADRPVDMGEALSYRHVNDFLEGLEDETGQHVVRIREHSGGAGSRAAAKELRTFLENITNSGAGVVEIDFSGQAVVSSSFADEVVGKLVAKLGFVTFTRRYRLSNMNPTVAGLIDRAIAKRLAIGE